MALLKSEKDLIPPDLFDLSEIRMPWWVAHVRSRQEKALARHLVALGVPFYLPHFEKRIRRAGRLFVSHLPLFPGYIFCRGTGEERLTALRTRLVCQILAVSGQRDLTAELAQLRSLQESGASLAPHPVFSPGDSVRVSQGPFQGYCGVVVRSAGRPRLIVSISMLRKAVAVEFEQTALTLASPGMRPGLASRRAANA